ncbi:MAG: hypothetical protein GF381_03535 [Candidatus Pacebacteria bacterium]|nr:hypothetical protein [Candidatus Paceibacterota bacterium]
MTKLTKLFQKSLQAGLSLWLSLIFSNQVGASLVGEAIAAQDPGDSPDSVIGRIKPPPGVENYNEGNTIGIFIFMSQMIKLVTIVAGIWTMFNFIMAGWTYLTAGGDSSAGEKVSKQMTNSVVGLVIVALAYSIAALVGLIIFGDASYILNPQIQTIGDI